MKTNKRRMINGQTTKVSYRVDAEQTDKYNTIFSIEKHYISIKMTK